MEIMEIMEITKEGGKNKNNKKKNCFFGVSNDF